MSKAKSGSDGTAQTSVHIGSVAYPVLEATGELLVRESVKNEQPAAGVLTYQPKTLRIPRAAK